MQVAIGCKMLLCRANYLNTYHSSDAPQGKVKNFFNEINSAMKDEKVHTTHLYYGTSNRNIPP